MYLHQQKPIKIKLNLSIFILANMHTFRNLLSDYLIRCNHLQTIGESIRQNIANNKFTQYETIFERMDVFKKGYLIPSDFSEFMLENKIYASEQQLYVIFREFDQERIGTVTLERVKSELLPKENAKLVKEALERKYYPASSRLQIDLQYQLTKYFEHMIRMHTQLQEIRHKLNQFYLLYAQEAFSLIDRKKLSQIIPNDIDYFLRSSGKVLKNDQTIRIFRVLSQTKNPLQPRILSYERFYEHIHPFGRGFYVGYAERLVEKKNLQREFISRKVLLEEQAIRNSRRKIEAKLQIQNLRNSRRLLQQKLVEKEIQIARSRVLQDSINRKLYY